MKAFSTPVDMFHGSNCVSLSACRRTSQLHYNGLFEIESAETPTDVTALNLNPIIIGKANDSSNAAANHCLDTQS